MGLFTLLKSVGNRLGLIRVVEVPDVDKPTKIKTRTLSLAALKTELRNGDVQTLAELPAELAVPFAKVFETAGVKAPAHGWTIDRLQQVLQTDQYKTMERVAVQQAILGLLASEKAPVEDLVKDAVARDQALDSYEGFVRKKMLARVEARQRRAAELQQQISALQEEQGKLDQETTDDRKRFAEWHDKKIGAEKQLAWAVGYLLDKAIVTVDSPHDL